MEDDKPMELRDKLAIEILSAVLAAEGSYQTYAGYYHRGICIGIVDMLNCQSLQDQENGVKQFENIARAAYKMADIMRRVRMSSFE
jgi:hypothetical protein